MMLTLGQLRSGVRGANLVTGNLVSVTRFSGPPKSPADNRQQLLALSSEF
jgi:hypothetical protein